MSRNVMRRYARAVEDVRHAQARIAETTSDVIEGRGTLGSKLADFVTVKLGRIDMAAIDRYLYLQEQLAVHQGELILICRCWTEEITTLNGGPAYGNESYTHVYTDLILGLVNGKKLRIDEAGCHLNLKRYVARMPMRYQAGRKDQLEWELFRGPLNLDLSSHGVRAESLFYQGFDWSLPLDEKMDTRGFKGNSMMPQLETFPDPPLKLSIAVGNVAVDDWLIEHTALMGMRGLAFDKAFELLGHPLPPKADERHSRKKQAQ